MNARILVTDPIAEEGIAVLAEQAQVDVRLALKPDELRAAIADYDALVVRSETKVTRAVIEAAPRLRIIARAGVGVDNIDVDAATERGIVVVNAPTGNTVSAAELTVALILALARHVPQADASLRRGEWSRQNFMGVEVRGKTVGIIGLGQVGAAVARRLRGLEMTVLAYDPYVPEERARLLGVELAAFDEVLRRADFLTLHTTLTPETTHLIGREQIAAMKPGSRLINTARGGLVDETALLEALNSGHIAGAGLDVFEQEPPPGDNPLLTHPRVICVPHLGASTAEAQERVAVDVAREVLLVLSGQLATAAVNAPFVDPETLAVVGPYLDVAQMCGTLATQLSEGQWRSVRLKFQGELANHDVTALKASAVAGLLATISEEHVNLVSVNHIIAHRGWQVIEEMDPDAGSYANLVTVELRTSAGVVAVSGTRVHSEPHIVEINGAANVDISRGGQPPGHCHILILENEDRPGRVGAVGTELGQMEVNISSMDVGRRDGGMALMVLTVHRALTSEELHRIGAIPGIERVVQARI